MYSHQAVSKVPYNEFTDFALLYNISVFFFFKVFSYLRAYLRIYEFLACFENNVIF